MKLIRLEIQGFKSFKDKTTIHFDEGITGIVGPNGCGKSNIVDALFWVMGEQSATHLRGSKMKDLIFAGSSKYTPAAWAAVTLVLLNDTGKHIHIGNQVVKPQEIALTRKLYRNGETEYRINGIPARLKDIHEVFMDTGAGAKSYSIIAQGEINKLVQAKPEERRVMIEEVAGVTKFKIRKKESLKKIENTQSNLHRLEDLQTEIYKNLKSLEGQAEKAEKARTLKEKVKRHELIIKSHREFEFLNEFKQGKKVLEDKAIELEDSSLRKNHLELALEDERFKKDDFIEQIDLLQGEYNEMVKELAANEEALKHLKKARIDKEGHIESRFLENKELEIDIISRKEKLEELKVKLDELESMNLEEMDFSDFEEKVLNQKENLEETSEEMNDLSMTLEAARVELRDADQLVFRNSSKLDEYSTNLEDITLEIEEIETNTADFSDELLTQRDEALKAKDVLVPLENEFESLKNEMDLKSRELRDQEPILRELSKEVIQLESKKQALIDINKSGEGIKEGALSFIQADGNGQFEILGNIIECDPQYAKCLEVLFEHSFDALISKEAQFKALGDWSKTFENQSFDCIIPFDHLPESGSETLDRLALKGCVGITAIADLIKVNDNDYQKELIQYFNGFFIIENLTADLALKISHEISFRGLVSLDGGTYLVKTSNGTQLSVRNGESLAMGVVQRNNLINEMSISFNDKKQQLDLLEKKSEANDTRVEHLKSEYEVLNKKLQTANNHYIAIKSALEAKESNFGSTSSRLGILKKRKQDISKLKLSLLESDEELEESKSHLEEKVSDLSEAMTELKDKMDEIKASYEDDRSELLSLKANAKTFNLQLETMNSQISDVDSQVNRYTEKKMANTQLLEQFEKEIEDCNQRILTLEVNNADQAEVMSDKDNYLNIIKDELTALLTAMQERESEVKQLTSIINKIEKMNVELNLKIEQIIIDEEILVKDCFDIYRVDLRSSLSAYLEILPMELAELKDLTSMYSMEGEHGVIQIEKEEFLFDKKYPSVLKESKEKLKRYKTDLNRLGEINWQAIEDYDRQKLRYDFLKQQELELKQSLDDLTVAISHIDEKSKTRFKEAFNAVNERFSKVFPIIFGGGEARLEVVGDLDSIECGIDIIAKPPGKKMQSINLMSGGEKAMTAVSLIFSIFLVKPSPFCLLDEVDAPLDDANVGRFNELLREMSSESQFILITHNKKTMELNDTLYGVTMQEPGVSKAVSVQLH